jgi:hypothetical protein
MPRETLFDIFSGEISNHPVWLETVEGLHRARERMARLAAERPGHYFIYDSSTGKLIAETSPVARKASS